VPSAENKASEAATSSRATSSLKVTVPPSSFTCCSDRQEWQKQALTRYSRAHDCYFEFGCAFDRGNPDVTRFSETFIQARH
jgi:hypothetical protein